MRRLGILLLCLLLLGLPGQASDPPRAALTFDDGPSGRFTRALLEGLEQRQAKATFFLCGYRLREDPALGRQILAAGHEIGLHGDSHRDLRSLSPDALEKELADCRAALPPGCRPLLLRPPGGLYDDRVCRAAREEELAVILWSVDPRDWAIHDADQVAGHVLEHVRDGDIILMHDLSDSSVEAALDIADALQRRGFRLCTVSELAGEEAMEPGRVYRRFP